jgi:hypothetical protein
MCSAARRGWTTATDHGKLEPLLCGYLLKVARLGARAASNGRAPEDIPVFDEELYTFARTPMIDG